MPQQIQALREEWIPALSEFLIKGLCHPGDYSAFAAPDVLRWKYLSPRGPWKIPRSLLVMDGESITAHAGICTTEFLSLGKPSEPVAAIHIVDWLSNERSASLGALLMFRAFALAPVQYAFGCTPAAARVLVRAGFEEVAQVPLFHRVVSRRNPRVWRTLHGAGGGLKQFVYRAFDLVQSFRSGKNNSRLQLREVTTFGREVEDLLGKCAHQLLTTSRSPALLNYYLTFPRNGLKGWILEKNSKPQGFAITTLVEKPGLRHGRIVECFLPEAEPSAWADAVAALAAQLRSSRPDLVSCAASTSWMSEGLQKNGFLRRGRLPVYLRDPQKHLNKSMPLHLSFLEADLAYI